MIASVLQWLRNHKATLGFSVLSVGVVLALWLSYRQGEQRQTEINDLQTATAYICEVTKVLDSAVVQFQLLDTNVLSNNDDLNPALRTWLMGRVEVFGELHEALLNEKPCATVE